MSEEIFMPYDVPGVGTVTAHEGDSYVVAMLDGRSCGFPAQNGVPSEANAAADIAYSLAHPQQPPTPADPRPIGTRIALIGSFHHADISSSNGVTLLGVIPAGWAMVDFQANVDQAFDPTRTISSGTLASPTRWVNGLAVSTTGLKQATPGQLYPQSVAVDTNVYLKKSGPTTTGDILTVSAILERKY